MTDGEEPTRRVRVEVEDPELSAEANRALTREVRAALDADEVQLPEDRAREVGRDHPEGATFFSTLWSLRIVVGLAAAAFVVLGAVVGLSAGEWWVLPLVLVVFGLATAFVVFMVVQTSTNVEKPSNPTIALLEEEGVQDPERLFNDHVQEFAGGGHESRTKKTLSAGDDERTVEPWQNERQAAFEQQTAMTPSSDAVPIAPGEAPEDLEKAPVPAWIPLAIYASVAVVCLLIPLLAGGGGLWLVPAITLPLVLLAAFYQARMFGLR